MRNRELCRERGTGFYTDCVVRTDFQLSGTDYFENVITLLDTSTLRIYLPLFATCVRGVVVARDACRAIDSKSSDTALHPCIDRQSGVGVGSPILFTSPEVDAQALRTRTTQYTA